MDKVVLKPLYHREQECIGLFYNNVASLNNIVRKLRGIKWSQTNKCWYLPLSPESYNQLYRALNGKAILETGALKDYLEKRKKGITALPVITKKVIVPKTAAVVKRDIVKPVVIPTKNVFIAPVKTTHYKNEKIHAINSHVLRAMEEKLKLKAYSPSTLRTYLQEMSHLLGMLKDIPADELLPDHLKRYLLYCAEQLKLKENSLHSKINALKFYYEQVLHREKFFWEIPRPKKAFLLPKVLSEDELSRLFSALENQKHKAMLFTAYSAGLRVSEIAALKLKDIDSGRMQIRIENAKGKKDRYVNLSPVLLDILRAYLRNYKQKPVKFLFESEQTGESYPTRTIQRIFYMAKSKARIQKDVGIHSLRHSFATHMLEKGIDIRYIKDLLGHFNIKTTERYLHVKKEQLVNIISPLDDLWRKGKIDW